MLQIIITHCEVLLLSVSKHDNLPDIFSFVSLTDWKQQNHMYNYKCNQ